MTTQFLTDQAGKRVAVVLPVEDFNDLMEDVSDLAAVAERRHEERISLEQVKERLIADGLL
jgi:PHD/YefM family antitoxin component YafN of YafNO toxin-antitoxin module